jgi:2-desacetyl-2-hydroxyethyl bacteriochlorophyllide A dehydrogenase
MRAVRFHAFGGPETLQLDAVPAPEPGADEVLVKIHASGVNHLDIWLRTGARPGIETPHTPGSEAAGEIVQVGEAVRNVTVGQRVAISPWAFCGVCAFCLQGEESVCDNGHIIGTAHNQGGYAEYISVPASIAIPIPDSLSYDAAAALTLAAITSWHMLYRRTRIEPGEWVLVQAAGSGVGAYAVQIARFLGARIIATAGSRDKLERAVDLGAEETINYTEQDLESEVKRITDGRGVDVVFEHVGEATWEQSIRSLARNGRLVTCGATTGRGGKVDIGHLYTRQLSLLGSMGGNRLDLEQVLSLADRGLLSPVLDTIYPLEDAAEAHRRMAAREQFGKMLLHPAE